MGGSEDRVIKKLYMSKLKEEGMLADPKYDGLMAWRKISE
jgi:hypothetical protein